MRDAMSINRRAFLGNAGLALGTPALATLLGSPLSADSVPSTQATPVNAKRSIDLFMHGGPSQIDLFDYKPKLKELDGQELPP